MLKRFFKSFIRQDDEDEFDDVEIINGKLIYKSEKGQSKETLPKVEDIVSGWEQGRVIKKDFEKHENFSQKIIGLESELCQLGVLPGKPINPVIRNF